MIEVLHVSRLYEDVDEQPNFEIPKLRPASNLVELSIQYHDGGGTLWQRVLEDDRLSPKLSRFGSCNVSSFNPNIGSPFDFTALVGTSFGNHALAGRLGVFVTDEWEETEFSENKLFLGRIWTWGSDEDFLPRLVRVFDHVHIVGRPLDHPDVRTWKRMLAKLRSISNRTPSFLSLPFSRASFTPDILSIFASIEDLGIELHFSRDEEEEDSISLIPQSFINFVEKQKKLKEEKEKEENEGDDQVRGAADGIRSHESAVKDQVC